MQAVRQAPQEQQLAASATTAAGQLDSQQVGASNQGTVAEEGRNVAKTPSVAPHLGRIVDEEA
jgi:hypothetical protein